MWRCAIGITSARSSTVACRRSLAWANAMAYAAEPPPTSSMESALQPGVVVTAAEQHPAETDGHEALTLLQRAHDQPTAKQQTIETSLAQIDALRIERDTVTEQLAALAQAMSAFRGAFSHLDVVVRRALPRITESVVSFRRIRGSSSACSP